MRQSDVEKTYVVYILECSDGSLYTGIARDVARRFDLHRMGKGAKYTAAHIPKAIVYEERHVSRSSALKRESMIKRMKRMDKLALIRAGGEMGGALN